MLKRAMAILLAAGLTLALGTGVFAAPPTGITYANGYFTGLISTNTYQYRTDAPTGFNVGWTTISGVTTLKADKGKVYWIKIASDPDYSAASCYTYSVPGEGTLPVLTGVYYDPADGMLKGLSNDWQYNFTSATPAATAWRTITGGAIKIALTDRPQNIWFRTKAIPGSEASAAVLYVLEAGSASDLTTLGIDFVSEKFILPAPPADTGWKYTTQSPTYTGPYLYDMDNTSTCYPQSTYYVRGPGAAVGAKLVTPSRPAAPSAAAFNAEYIEATGNIDVTVTGININDLRWRLNTDGFWADSTSGMSTGNVIHVPPPPATQPNQERILYVATKAQGTSAPISKNPDGSYSVSVLAGKFASFNASIRIWKSLGAGFEALRYDSIEGKIKGANNTMWYQVLPYENGKAPSGPDATEPWIRPTGTNVTLNIDRKDFDQAVYFCLDSKVGDPNGQTLTKDDYVELKLPYTVDPTEAFLYLENDAEAVVITSDPAADYRYSTNYVDSTRGGTWKPLASLSSIDFSTPAGVPQTGYDLSEVLKGNDVTLYITIWPKNPNEKPEPSAVWREKIGAGPAKPSLNSLTYEGTASNTSLRFKVSGSPVLQYKWATIPTAKWEVFEPDADGYYNLPAGYTAISYLLRAAPSGGKQGSVVNKGSTAAMPAAPKVKPDYKKGILVIKAGQSYWDWDLNGGLGDWTAPIKVKKELPLEMLYGSTVQVKTAGTAKKPASQIAYIDILDRYKEDGIDIVPSQDDITLNAKGKLVMTPGTRQLEYLNGTKWKKGVPKLNTMDAINGVPFRYAADSAHAPSESVTLKKPASMEDMANLAAAGSLTADLNRSMIYGLDPSAAYVYRVKKKDTDKWKDIPAKNIIYIEDGGAIRKAFDLTTLLKGKAVTIEIGLKVDDPVTPLASYVFKEGPAKKKITITGYLPSATPGGVGSVQIDYKGTDLQYKKETEREWKDVPNGDGILPGGFTAFNYQFRLKPAGADTQGSPAVKAKVSAVPKAPSVKVDYKNEKVSLKAGWSYKVGDAGVWSTPVASTTTPNLNEKGMYGETVYFRVVDIKNGKKPTSLVTTLRINPRFSDDLNDEIILTIPSGASYKYALRPGAHPVEYLLGTKWKAGVPPYVKDKIYSMRYAADSAHGVGEMKFVTADADGKVTIS